MGETWTLNVSDIKKLQAFGMKCLHKLLNISWHDHISNKEVAAHALRTEESPARTRPTHGRKPPAKN